MKRVLTFGFGILASTVFASFLYPMSAAADYNSANLISDAVFQDSGSMSQSDIQNFLSAQRSGLAGFQDVEDCGSPSGAHYSYYATYYSCGQNVPASKIIYDSAQAYHISPRAILATLQKEQSLVTTPNPTASQLQCAMGYNSCANDNSFFLQVDNGTWQFRTYIELMNGKNWWGMTPNYYPCNDGAAGIPAHDPSGNNHKFYYPGLYPGRNVTFYDYYGDAYANFTLANSATAGMYCYTPHVYPGSSNVYYSGSYNFVYWFERWFGSTQNIVPRYNWTLTQQAVYSNSSRTALLTGDAFSLAPGAKAYVTIQARNNTNQTWTQGSLRLGTNNPQDRASIFYDSNTWASASRVDMVDSSVLPGDIATFKFALAAPATTGSYTEYFNLLIEGTSWLNDIGLCLPIDVVTTTTASNNQNTGLTSGQSITPGQYLLSPDTQTTLNLQGDGNLVDYSGSVPVWANHASSDKITMLAMQPDGNLVEYGRDGSGNSVPYWASNTANNPGARLVLQSDGNIVIYSVANQPLWYTSTTSNPDHLSRVDKRLYNSTNLFTGQSLDTADRKYHLKLQGDGNLVLYSPTRAIWQSGTAGKAAAFLSTQSDGNLVLYDTTGKPLWNSGTSGRGAASLLIQQDGNLVLYNSNGGATWSTATAGVQ